MSNKQKKIIEILSESGLLAPTTPEAIERFKKDNNVSNECPANWENPIDIIKMGRRTLSDISSIVPNVSAEQVQNLAMAARQGKSIPNDIRKKMLEDKKNAQK